MFKSLIKSFLKPNDKSYKILSYFLHYSTRKYVPKTINAWEPILENLSKASSIVHFVQVGSNDGESGDPLNFFVKKYNWHGVLIEPIPFLFEKLKSNYAQQRERLKFLNLAVSAQDEEFKTFYAIDEKHRNKISDWYYQLGTFNKNVLSNHGVPNFEEYVVEIQVPVKMLQEIIKENMVCSNIDLLHIDAEGYDFEILQTLDFAKTLPKIILIEFYHLEVEKRQQLFKMFRKHRYCIYKRNLDYIAVHASVHDGFMEGTQVAPFWQY